MYTLIKTMVTAVAVGMLVMFLVECLSIYTAAHYPHKDIKQQENTLPFIIYQ